MLPATLEGVLLDICQLIDRDRHSVDAEIVFGQAVRIHILGEALVGGHFDILKAGMIARAGYRGDYVAASETSEMLRPSRP